MFDIETDDFAAFVLLASIFYAFVKAVMLIGGGGL